MKFRILGRVEVVADGASIPITRPQARALLFVLVRRRNQVVSAERLVDLVWGPGAGERRGLRSLVWDLRQRLPQGRLITDEAGYKLRIDGDDWVDLDQFRALDRAGRAALRAGKIETAARVLEEALALWPQARPAEVFPATPGIDSLVRGLVEEYLDARNAGIEARLALGRHRELLPELRALVADDPINERLWAYLMVALYRCGLKTEALNAFTQAADALEAHAGAEPGARLRRLRRHIEIDDPQVDYDPVSVPGVGPPETPRQLPPDLGDFVGRSVEITTLRKILAGPQDASTVTVTQIIGPPGVGKTALALHVAHSVVADYPDGQLFIPLSGASPTPREPASVLAEILRTLGMGPGDIPDSAAGRAALYRSRLAGRRILIVCDDAANASQVRPLLPGTPGCALIATSRTQLPGLTAAPTITLDPLDHAEGLGMLSRIIGQSRLDSDPDAADAIINACGALPLAVRTVAERLKAHPTWPLSHLARAVADEKHRLDALVAGDLEVRASLGLSYTALDPRTRRGFRLLALAGPSDVAGWVADLACGEPAHDVIDTLTTRSLLATTGVDALGQPRYRFHDLLRDYATELLADDPDTDAARIRLIRGWLELTALADLPPVPYFPPPPPTPGHPRLVDEGTRRLVAADPYTWFGVERANILAAIHAAHAAGAYRLAGDLAVRASAYLHQASYHDDAAHLWTSLATAADRADDTAFAAHARLRAATVIGGDRRDPTQALPLINGCIQTLEATADLADLARAYGMRAYCAQATGRFADAHHDAEHGLALARDTHDTHAEYLCLRVLGLTRAQLGDHDSGIHDCQQALALANELHPIAYTGMALFALIHVHLIARHYDRAIELCHQGLRLSIAYSSVRAEAYFSQQLGVTHRDFHQYGKAIEALEQAVEKFQALHENRQAALCLQLLAHSYRDTGHHHHAIACLKQSLSAYQDLELTEQENQLKALLREYQATTDPHRSPPR